MMNTKGNTKVPLHPKMMNPGPVEEQPLHSLPSHYSGSLASDKYFSQKEINTKPTKRINAALSKNSGPEIKKDKWGADFDELESMRSSTTSFYSGQEVQISKEQKEKIRSRPFSGKFKPNKITEDKYEEVNNHIDYDDVDNEALRKKLEVENNERMRRLNEFENMLLGMKSYSQDIDSLIDADESREELERNIMDNNYMRDKIEEKRMNESTYSESSNKPVKSIGYIPPPKPINYKPNIVKGQSEVKSQQYTEDKEEREETFQERIARQIEAFHKVK